jgi:hypothetical protein
MIDDCDDINLECEPSPEAGIKAGPLLADETGATITDEAGNPILVEF